MAKLSNEDKRQVCLDLIEEICKAGSEGIAKSELLNKMKSKEGYSIDVYENVLLNEYVGAIGKNNATKGVRRWTRYVLDDQSIAEGLVNDYFDSRMTELDRWILYRDIAEFVDGKEYKVASEAEVMGNFCIQLPVLVEMNAQLTLMNAPLDYPEGSKNGKFKLSEHTMAVINAKITELEAEKALKVRDERRKNLELARASKLKKNQKEVDVSHLKPLDSETRKKIQLRLVNIIYSAPKSKLEISGISFNYHNTYGENIKYNAIESMMKNIPGVSRSKDLYKVDDITKSMLYLDPIRAKVKIDVVFERNTINEMELKRYENMRFSRSIGGCDIYMLEDWNTYDLYIQLMNLLLMGASIDKVYAEKVKSVMVTNMSIGKKSIL